MSFLIHMTLCRIPLRVCIWLKDCARVCTGARARLVCNACRRGSPRCLHLSRRSCLCGCGGVPRGVRLRGRTESPARRFWFLGSDAEDQGVPPSCGDPNMWRGADACLDPTCLMSVRVFKAAHGCQRRDLALLDISWSGGAAALHVLCDLRVRWVVHDLRVRWVVRIEGLGHALRCGLSRCSGLTQAH